MHTPFPFLQLSAHGGRRFVAAIPLEYLLLTLAVSNARADLVLDRHDLVFVKEDCPRE